MPLTLPPSDRRAAENLKRLFDHWQAARGRVSGRTPSQSDLAARVGVSQGAISQFLRGRTRIGAEMTLRLADALGVHPGEIRDDLPYPDTGPAGATGAGLPGAGPPGTAPTGIGTAGGTPATGNKADAFVGFFRSASPYIHAHRGRTFVVSFGGEALEEPTFINLIHDLAQLVGLGIRLVVTYGIRPQVTTRMASRGMTPLYQDGIRITTPEALGAVKEATGMVRMEIESALSRGLADTPMAQARMQVVSGNFVTARPVGVREGIDFGHTGEVRRVDADGIRRQLDAGAVVLVAPVGYSPTGEMFNLSAPDVAAEIAAATSADKLICLVDGPGLTGSDGRLVRELTLPAAERMITGGDLRHTPHAAAMNGCIRALKGGVNRAHLLGRDVDGGLLLELFTRDGAGTLVTAERFEGVRPATIEDVGGILALIAPLEASGVLVKRSRERLEMEIGNFMVMERDGLITACGALYPYPAGRVGELACLAVHPDYRGAGRGEKVMAQIEQTARGHGIRRLFVLTTQTAHWFLERGFAATDVRDLPVTKKALYNYQRSARVYIKSF